ncbi:MAG: hypothetical protein A370_03121 [Clostridium sp. Maddingley MBC34-26]|nr:MAG: hypothetical protein A370_03121 [Clostridium sp. Maddingley MBC34-26]
MKADSKFIFVEFILGRIKYSELLKVKALLKHNV